MKRSSGMTLMELIIASFILSIGVLAAVGSFQYITTSVQFSKSRTLSSNLAQEQVEKLKNLSYYTLLVTTSPTADSHVPVITYDPGNYPPQTIIEGGIPFIRETRVDFAYQNGSVISTAPWTSDDTALKQITVYVLWQERAEWKYQQIQNLYANPAAVPLDASASGWVKTPSNVAIPGALVQVIDNPSWYGYADTSGSANYRFSVSPGSYTLQASSDGYYTSTTNGYLSFTSGNATPYNFSLSPISSGTVTGNIYKTDHLVIAAVVATTGSANNIEVIELYNPTTAPINIGTNGGVNNPYIAPITWDHSDNPSPHRLIYVSTYVPVNRYYLITNTYPGAGFTCDPITIFGITTNPDACWKFYSYSHAIEQSDAGGVSIGNSNSYLAGWSGFNWSSWPASRIDSVAWNQGGGGHSAPSDAVEGTAITPLGSPNGMGIGEAIGRMTDPGTISSTYGMGYDSDNNRSNFLDVNPIPGPANNSSTTALPRAGTPATGAIVNMNDLLSNSATCTDTTVNTGTCAAAGGCRVCSFSLVAATGTWTMDISSSGLYAQIQNITVQTNVSTGVPNGATTPTWTAVGNNTVTLINNTTTYAFVSGHVYSNTGAGLYPVKVSDANGRSIGTLVSGAYLLLATTGTISLTANPNDGTMNRAYTTQSRSLATVAGGLYDNQDFTLELAGIIRGYFQTSSNTPLPRRVAVAVKTVGTDTAQAASDNSGYFSLQNLSTGTYIVTPQLDTLETVTPPSATVVLASTGTTNTISTFTITSGIAEITGQVLIAASTQVITTGALIVASPSSIAGSLPPTQSGATGAACNPCYYSVSSDATGNYTLQVRSSTTPYKVYGWYTTISAQTPTVTKSNGGTAYNVTVSTPGQIVSQNFSW